MRKLAPLLMTGALTLLVAGGALAKTSTQKVSGTITKLDASAKTFAVEHGKQEMRFELASDAKIMSGAKAESLDSLSVGQNVSVTYVDEGSAHRAQRVDLAKAATHKAAAAKPGSAKY